MCIVTWTCGTWRCMWILKEFHICQCIQLCCVNQCVCVCVCVCQIFGALLSWKIIFTSAAVIYDRVVPRQGWKTQVSLGWAGEPWVSWWAWDEQVSLEWAGEPGMSRWAWGDAGEPGMSRWAWDEQVSLEWAGEPGMSRWAWSVQVCGMWYVTSQHMSALWHCRLGWQ